MSMRLPLYRFFAAFIATLPLSTSFLAHAQEGDYIGLYKYY